MSSADFTDPHLETTDLTPQSVAKFLATTGWERIRESSGVMSIWESETGASLMLPEDPTFLDFEPRLEEALGVISRTHNVRGQALFLEIASASSDILLLRSRSDVKNGSIPIAEAESLLQGARKMLTAAALAAVSPKANFGPARPAAVKEFIADDVRMGHTLRGSFVITILTRLDDDDQETNPASAVGRGDLSNPADESRAIPTDAWDSPIEMSFNRRVMTTLANGLSAAVEVLSHESLSLDEAIESGMSAQLLDSIVQMSGASGDRRIGTQFKWSPSHLAPPPSVPRSIELPYIERERSEHLKKRLRTRPALDFDQVIGPVVRLERSADDALGVAVVDGNVGRERKRVRVELPPSIYAVATSAHDSRVSVVAEGKISFEKGSYWIRSSRRFEVI